MKIPAIVETLYVTEKILNQNWMPTFESLIYVLSDSSTHIPHTCAPHQSTRIPGWNELVKPYREDAIFSKWMHGDVGRPTTG